MRLLEAILDANRRRIAGDATAIVPVGELGGALPVAALTCIDARLNRLVPEYLGVPEEQFIWLRNAGNIITGPLSSTMRSLALACAVKGGRQIVIIGHSDCQVGKTTTMQLIERFRALGIERHLLPDNLNEFFGTFGSERQNVLKATELVRRSPLIGPKVPVHGLLVDIETGKLEWLVNGYDTLGTTSTLTTQWNEVVKSAGQTVDALKTLTDFNFGEMKFPETKIGEVITKAEEWVSDKIQQMEITPPANPPAAPPAVPPKIPLPPPVRPRIRLNKGSK
ncbi:MAG TPA: carbonic anhydrase [Candidatus Sulfotelmatobacter sp.]|nr:carbonic anhydrase [Candidatus Sulfotelmatobacter sp.]